jgi:light-regulated signal transduction histidine kinase (bacteriophytochrome)
MNTILQDIQTGNQKSPLRTGTEKELLLLQEELKTVKENASRFTSVVAHDLQAPLRMITGFLDLLSGRYSQQLDEKALQYISFAVKGAEKMKHLIKDLQLYTSLYNDNSPLEEINLKQVVIELIAKNEATWEPVKTSWEIGALPLVYGKKNQISLLFEELLSNAVKFCTDKAPQIAVSATDASPGWKITVADQGIGFDPGFRESIFEVFRKLHPEDGRFGGTGIGLALCKRICELHGWDIRAVPIPGKGSEFIITIPVLNQSSKSC